MEQEQKYNARRSNKTHHITSAPQDSRYNTGYNTVYNKPIQHVYAHEQPFYYNKRGQPIYYNPKTCIERKEVTHYEAPTGVYVSEYDQPQIFEPTTISSRIITTRSDPKRVTAPSKTISYAYKSRASTNEINKDISSVTKQKNTKKEQNNGIKKKIIDIDARSHSLIIKKKERSIESCKRSPGKLCINEAYPPKRILQRWTRLMQAHRTNSLSNKTIFVWMPNASWANDGKINGFTFSVEKCAGNLTPVVPDMFPMDKMFHGLLCIQLPNTISSFNNFSRKRKSLTKIQHTSPLQALNSISPMEIEAKLNKLFSDDDDFSSDSSYVGFYVSTNPDRGWEENVWLVVQCGDKDISRTTNYYLQGTYNPDSVISAHKKNPKRKVFTKDYEKIKIKTQQIKQMYSSSDDGYIKDACNEKGEENSSSDTDEGSEEYSDTYSDDDGSDDEDDYYNESGYLQTDKREAWTFDKRQSDLFIPDEQKKAWKYVKVINEMYQNAFSLLPEGSDIGSSGLHKPEYTIRRKMTWENNIDHDHVFINKMEHQVKLKRWSMANKLASILGYDLWLDFGLTPENRKIDNHKNVVHVVTNTFQFKKRDSLIIYYGGSFNRRNKIGGIPVPISPLCGIKILFGPQLNNSPFDNNNNNNNKNSKRGDKKQQQKKKKVNEDISEILATVSSSLGMAKTPRNVEYICLIHKGNHEKTKEKYIHTKETHEMIDNGDYMGDIWSTKSEFSSVSTYVDFHGAFPFGTGRRCSFLRLTPKNTILSYPKIDTNEMGNCSDEEKKTKKSKGSTGDNSLINDEKCLLPHLMSTTMAMHERAKQVSAANVSVISPVHWGKRGLWFLSGHISSRNNSIINEDVYSDPFYTMKNTVLFTWNDKRYSTHPRLSPNIFRKYNPSLQNRHVNLGWNHTTGSVHLKPFAVCLASPVDPEKRSVAIRLEKL